MRNGITISICLTATLTLGIFLGKELNDGDHASWSRGYTECMNDVVVALASCEEVRLGNLIINEPNVSVSDMTFFVVDPNQWGIVMNGAGGTVSDGTFNCLAQQPN